MSDETTFEQAMDELEEIVDALERQDLNLDEALDLFEKGVGRLREAARRLDAAHGRVEELIEGALGSWEFRPVGPGQENDGEPGGE
jgi:exodeoxyribonuclease VII small subunit